MGKSKSSNATTDRRIGATDEAKVATEGSVAAGDEAVVATEGSFATGDESVVVTTGGAVAGDESKILGQNALNVEGTLIGERANTGLQATGGGVITIQTLDPTVVAGSLKTVEKVVAETQSGSSQLQEGVNKLLANLAESKATSGESTLNKNALFLGAAGLAAIVIVALVSRRS